MQLKIAQGRTFCRGTTLVTSHKTGFYFTLP